MWPQQGSQQIPLNADQNPFITPRSLSTRSNTFGPNNCWVIKNGEKYCYFYTSSNPNVFLFARESTGETVCFDIAWRVIDI